MHTWQNVEIITVLKCYCPLTFTFNYLSFLLLFLFVTCIFLPKYHKIFLKKVQVAMGSGTGFSSEFSGQVNLTWFTWLCSFFISFMVWRISLMPAAKLSVTIQAVQGRWFHMGGYVQFICEWVKWSSHKQACVYTLKVLSRKVYIIKTFRDDAFQKRLNTFQFSWW